MIHENQSSIYFQYIITGYLRLFSEAVSTPSSGRITIYFGENDIIDQNNSYFRSLFAAWPANMDADIEYSTGQNSEIHMAYTVAECIGIIAVTCFDDGILLRIGLLKVCAPFCFFDGLLELKSLDRFSFNILSSCTTPPLRHWVELRLTHILVALF